MNTLFDTDATRQPVVFVREGEAFANSRDVAEYFGKRHDHVLRDIDNLLRSLGSPNLGNLFVERSDYHEHARKHVRAFDLTRDGFVLLAMGFSGAKALQFKLKYIEAFNAMEAELRRSAEDFEAALNDPVKLRSLLVNYSEKVSGLQQQVSDMRPQVTAFDRIAHSDGAMCITDAAKTLQVPPRFLFKWMRTHGWIYGRTSNGRDVAYQSRIHSGDLEHKATTVEGRDGTERTFTQVLVTPKGLTRLAQALVPTGQAN